MERTGEKYIIPKKFDMYEHFFSYYGVTSGGNTRKEVVRLKANALQSKFLRTLPLHPSQKEVEETDEYTIFEYYIIPTLEFRKELLSCGSAVEVLSPQSLREEMRTQIQEMVDMYKA
jgi:predicted DNA-binding transcriptional regulator YafY